MGGGRVIGIFVTSGSGSSCRSRLRTEMRSPGNGCFLSPNKLHPASPRETNSNNAMANRIIGYQKPAGKKAADGAVAPKPSPPIPQIGLGGESCGHFGGSGARPLRCPEIIGKGLVIFKSAALVSGFEPSRRRQLKGGGAPRIARRRHRR